MKKKSKFFMLVLVIAFTFVLGFSLGGYFASLDTDVNKILKESELDAESFLIEQQLAETFGLDCEFSQSRLAALSEQLWKLGQLLGKETAEQELGKEGYNFLKRKFHLMQIKTYSLYKNLEKSCGKDFDVILFYFKRNNEDSKRQGEILNQIVKNFDTKVFAIEFDYSPELKFLEQFHKVSSAPTLVVNFEKSLKGLQDYETIKKHLENG